MRSEPLVLSPTAIEVIQKELDNARDAIDGVECGLLFLGRKVEEIVEVHGLGSLLEVLSRELSAVSGVIDRLSCGMD